MNFKKFHSDEDVKAFAFQYSSLSGHKESATVTEIGDGNINFVYRVADKCGYSVIVKQALPYVRIIGEGWPLSQDRIRIEAQTLQIAGQYCPDLAPEVYHFDRDLCAIVMEDIGAHQNLRHLLIARENLPLLGRHLGCYLASTLFYTSDFFLDPYAKKEQVANFINPDLCKITEDLFFVDPYCDHERNSINELVRTEAEALWEDSVLKLEVAKLKAKFLSQPQALLHGDLHSGSVFASVEGTKIIDPEFAFCGPIGFDVGSIVGNFLLSYAGHSQIAAVDDNGAYQTWLLQVINELWDEFETCFRQLVLEHGTEPSLAVPEYIDWFLKEIFSDSLGFAGTEIIRRTIGLAHVADIEEIHDLEKRAEAERLALSLGRRLIKSRYEIADVASIL
mgnify:CR=1 FL=1